MTSQRKIVWLMPTDDLDADDLHAIAVEILGRAAETTTWLRQKSNVPSKTRREDELVNTITASTQHAARADAETLRSIAVRLHAIPPEGGIPAVLSQLEGEGAFDVVLEILGRYDIGILYEKEKV